MAERLQIKSIRFKSGSALGQPALDIKTPNITVLVGPNNAGKSQTLRELEICCQGQKQEFKLISEVDLILPDTAAELISMLKLHKAEPPEGQILQPGHFWISRPVVRRGEQALYEQISENKIIEWFNNKTQKSLREVFVRTFTLRLDGRTRFDLVEKKETGPLEENPKNHLWALFVDDDAREKVRQFTEKAFGKHFVIDPTGMTHYRVRLSDRKPASKSEEKGLDSEAQAFYKEAPLVSSLGDGMRASIGLVSAVMSLSQRILLIDEPEAFLHPTLAHLLGNVLSTTVCAREASMIVATHSADFLMGCIKATSELRIVRLTYSEHKPTARSIDPGKIITLMNEPLLRSAHALRALFHRGVIVTEADADRAFYEEVNYRLLQNKRGIEDSLFMNAQNWQTIPRIIEPLRSLGIPAAAIFDFDVLMDKDFSRIWSLPNTDNTTRQSLEIERNEIKKLMEAVTRKTCKSSGIEAFNGADKERIQNFLDEMNNFGIFFVPVGELECWLAALKIEKTNKKSKWLTKMFNKLGSKPMADGYITPDENDVWAFIDAIENWISVPERLGIPI